MTTNLEKHHDLLQKAIDMEKRITVDIYAQCALLAKIHDEEAYLPEYESWSAFLDELDISEATASKRINIHRRLVVEFGIKPKQLAAAGSWASIAEILPYAKDKKTAEELVERITPLMPGDKRRMIRELRTGLDPERCRHQWYTVKICSLCGERHKIYEQS